MKPSFPLTHLLRAGLWYSPWPRLACPSTSWSWCTLHHLILLRTGLGALRQLKLRCVLESCCSSSCSNCNSLLAKVWCLTWLYPRYLLKDSLRRIPVAVDFTQRSFYFISSREIKGRKKTTDLYLSTEIHKIVLSSESHSVCCFRSGDSKSINELRCFTIIQTSRTHGWAELRSMMVFTHYRLVLLMHTWTPFIQMPVFCWALLPQVYIGLNYLLFYFILCASCSKNRSSWLAFFKHFAIFYISLSSPLIRLMSKIYSSNLLISPHTAVFYSLNHFHCLP